MRIVTHLEMNPFGTGGTPFLRQIVLSFSKVIVRCATLQKCGTSILCDSLQAATGNI